MSDWLEKLLQLIGMGLIAVGVAHWSFDAALIVAGLLLFLTVTFGSEV